MGQNPGYGHFNGPEGNNNPSWGNQPPNYSNNPNNYTHNNFNNHNGRFNGHINNGPSRSFHHTGRGGRQQFFQGRDAAPQTSNWDNNQNRYDDTSRGRDHDVRSNAFQGGPQDRTRTPPERARSEFAPAGDLAAKDEDAEPSLPAGRSRPNADVSPISEFSDHGKRQERTPPSTIVSYPSPPDHARSLSSIQNSSFTDLNGAISIALRPRNEVLMLHTDARDPPPPNASSYPSPGQELGLRPEGERSSRGNSRGVPSGSA